jgi:hypothetical protein
MNKGKKIAGVNRQRDRSAEAHPVPNPAGASRRHPEGIQAQRVLGALEQPERSVGAGR